MHDTLYHQPVSFPLSCNLNYLCPNFISCFPSAEVIPITHPCSLCLYILSRNISASLFPISSNRQDQLLHLLNHHILCYKSHLFFLVPCPTLLLYQHDSFIIIPKSSLYNSAHLILPFNIVPSEHTNKV